MALGADGRSQISASTAATQYSVCDYNFSHRLLKLIDTEEAIRTWVNKNGCSNEPLLNTYLNTIRRFIEFGAQALANNSIEGASELLKVAERKLEEAIALTGYVSRPQ